MHVLAKRTQTQRPAVVVAAVCFLVAGALLGAVPYQTLFALSPSKESQWYFVPYHPGWWVSAPLKVLLALLLLRGFAWSRYAGAVLVVGLLLAQLNTSLGPNYHSFPLAMARDVVCAVLQLAAVVLLFLPSASMWFRKRNAPSAT